MNIDIQQLEELLNKLPGQLRDQENKVVEAKNQVQLAKLEFDWAYSMAIQATQGNATEKKSFAVIKTKEHAEKLIEAQNNLDKEEVTYNYLHNRFISLRKISQIESDLIKSNLSGN